MFRGLSKLGIALTIIFVVSIVALFLQLFYFLWRRHRVTSNGGGNRLPQSLSSSSSSSSKQQQLLYFFCCQTNLSRVEPNSAPTPSSLDSSLPSPEPETEVIIDVLKLHSMRGPSRVLFTIKEEEREGVESAEQMSLCSSAEKEKKAKRVSLRECFEAGNEKPPLELPVAVDDHLVGGDSATPFSTPCASPLYFNPSATPTREIVGDSKLI